MTFDCDAIDAFEDEAERAGILAGTMIEVTRHDGHADRAVDALRMMLPPDSWTPGIDGYVRNLALIAANL